ncbi:class I SAM-dependent methyltransferase [Aliishimia ponticola]|uniref:Class I SAM-dependent methyltransferase n=1 Tax=Aliishimia ponticola TaxID=2499833 RepID=A0A4S4NJG9_9RHOB|nr:class I SAM-dependent methyltransferase [Aliishimia ponticola]THH38897.1 class I SAM-dependent methyltransferase [Aliishimia ponticola]
MDLNAIKTLHADMPRQGPGTADDVAWTVARLGLQGALRVVDAGCGPGADLKHLADLLPDATLTGIDAFPHLVAEAQARLGRRAQVVAGDMSQIEGPVDLIWCAGAVYFLGVTEALQAWRPALADGGVVAFSEPILPEGPREVAEDFWQAYPAITDMAGLTKRIESAGYTLIDSRDVQGRAPRWDSYFAPLETRVAALRPTADETLGALLDMTTREIDTWKRAPDQVFYKLCLVRPV